MPKKGLSFGAINKVLDKTRQTQRPPPKPTYNPPKNQTIENPKLKKKCSECHETKSISLFNISGTGKRHKPYCKKCEALLSNPKKMGKVIEKGNVKEEKITMQELQVKTMEKEERKEGRKKAKQQEKDKMPKQEQKVEIKNIFTATDYFMHVVVPFAIENKNCFTITKIKKDFNLDMDMGKAHHKVYKILMELVKLGYLKYKKVPGDSNKYYIPKNEVIKLVNEKNITKEQAMQIQPIEDKLLTPSKGTVIKEPKKEEPPKRKEPIFIQNKKNLKEKKNPTKPGKTKSLSVIYNIKVVEQIEAIAEKKQMDISKVLRIAAAQYIENNDKHRFTDGLVELIARFAKLISIEIKEDGKKEIGVRCKTSKDMFDLYNLLPPEQQKTVKNPNKRVMIFKWE